MKKNLNIQKLILIGIFTVFLIFAVYLALNIKMGISSDSWYHLRVSQKYSETLGIPSNGPDTYKWRDIEHIPYLYLWINGRILNLNSTMSNINEVILLRFVNILYSTLTLWGVYLLSKEFFKNRWLQILPTFLLSSTLMFVFLSSSINYDNLANMFSVFSILFFVRTLKNTGNIKYLLMMLILLCLGTLTKYTVMPLAFILVVLIGIDIIRNWDVWKRSFKGKYLYLLLPLILFGFLNIGVYGVNLFKYQSLTPECLDVLTYDQCLENGVFVRDNEWIPAVEVRFFDMVLSGERMDPIRYTGVWIWEMSKRVVGIMGDSSLFASNYIIPFYLLFLLLSFYLIFKNWRGWNKEYRYLSIATLFYLLVLLFVQNYNMYLKRGYPTLALQGRYMFPVISSFYVLSVLSFSTIKRKWFKFFVFISLVVLFFIGCYLFFITNVDSGWFGAIEY